MIPTEFEILQKDVVKPLNLFFPEEGLGQIMGFYGYAEVGTWFTLFMHQMPIETHIAEQGYLV